MANMMLIDGDLHPRLKKLAREHGSSIQKVASALLRESFKQIDVDNVSFRPQGKRGPKSKEARAAASQRMKQYWAERKKQEAKATKKSKSRRKPQTQVAQEQPAGSEETAETVAA